MDNKEFNHKDGVSLLKHFEIVIEDLAKYFESRLVAIEKAVEAAKESMEHRLVGMNEIRSTLTDQAATFPTKPEIKAELDSIKKELVDYHSFREEQAGLPSRLAMVEREVKDLNTFKDTQKGKASQSSVAFAYIFSAVTFIIGLIIQLTR
jgi:hypothetical protein